MITRDFASFPILTTERLTLRQLAMDDQQNVFALRSDTDINKYIDREPSKTIEDAIKFVSTVTDNIKKNSSIYWAITLTSSKTFTGTICLFNFSEENGKCEIGYELLTKFQRQGIMQEAVGKVIDYAFNTIGVQKIEAVFHRENRRSLNLLEKLSFKYSNAPDTTVPDLLCYYLKSLKNDSKQ